MQIFKGTNEIDGVELTPVIQQRKQYTALELMNMNRHERRRIGKLNSIKIPGIPIVIEKKKEVIAENKNVL